MKKCSKCGQEKPVSCFWLDGRYNRPESRCKDCHRIDARRYRKENPDIGKRRYWANRDKERERHLVRKYGITLAGYDELLEKQDGKCRICGCKEPDHKTFDVDHDHKTGEVRGLLCTSCNRMLGYAGDSSDRLIAGAKYLSRKRRQNL